MILWYQNIRPNLSSVIQSRKPLLAVVSADTLAAVLINHSTAFTTTSSSRIFEEPTYFLFHKLYSKEVLLLVWDMICSSVWLLNAMWMDAEWIQTCLTVALSRKKKEKNVNLERSSSPDKKPARQSAHFKTLYLLFHILHQSFGLCIRETNGIIMNIMWWCGSYTDD